MSQHRKRRGYRTQKVVADWLRENGWPHATSTGAGRQGADVENVPDLAIEIKARADFAPVAWVKQARASADGRLPLVLYRANGQGEKVEDYLAIVRLGDLLPLLHGSGYGDPDPWK